MYSREERYRSIEDMPPEYFALQKQKVSEDTYFYPSYHIAPPYGLLNDPNGLAYFQGEHHIFYQYHPVAPTHGLKYWYHLSTKDFSAFKDHGIALKPDSALDTHGVYSGGALVEGDQLVLFFTGNKFDSQWLREPCQAIAFMDKNNTVSAKHKIIEADSEYTGHFRDPKPWKQDEAYYLILGAQTQDLKGVLVLYTSDALLSPWRKIGNIETNFHTDSYMYECPDYFELKGKGILLFSPQGMKPEGCRFQNVYHVAYSVGAPLDLKNAHFNGSSMAELDKGFDFYAPQTYEDPQGRRILIAWLGIGDLSYPYDEENRWSQMLTIPRELSLEDDILIQTPLSELKNLRGKPLTLQNGSNFLAKASFELELELSEKFSLSFQNSQGNTIVFEGDKEYILDRSGQGVDVNIKYGTVRKASRLSSSSQKIRIFYDHSALEIFADQGRTVFTSRVFLKDLSCLIIEGLIQGQCHPMKKISFLSRT